MTNYRGHKMVIHGGGIDGFLSQMSWLPNQRIGAIVLTNSTAANIANIITYKIYDTFLGLNRSTRPAEDRHGQGEGPGRQCPYGPPGRAEAGTQPSHALSDYAGTYEHPGYGQVTITANGSGLELQFDSHKTKLNHFHYDVFEIPDAQTVVPISGRAMFLDQLGGSGGQGGAARSNRRCRTGSLIGSLRRAAGN